MCIEHSLLCFPEICEKKEIHRQITRAGLEPCTFLCILFFFIATVSRNKYTVLCDLRLQKASEAFTRFKF